MSFSIDRTGTRSGVANSVNSELYVPQQIKDLVTAIANASNPSQNGLHVKTSGHVDSTGGGNIYELKIEPVSLLLDPVAPAPLAPPAVWEAPAAAPDPAPAPVPATDVPVAVQD
jgi:hypothetical protein